MGLRLVTIHHLCENCYEVDPAYEVTRHGTRECLSCGNGRVLTIQEAADRIAELKSRLREYEFDETD